jgi:hypothetical protein
MTQVRLLWVAVTEDRGLKPLSMFYDSITVDLHMPLAFPSLPGRGSMALSSLFHSPRTPSSRVKERDTLFLAPYSDTIRLALVERTLIIVTPPTRRQDDGFRSDEHPNYQTEAARDA